MAVSSARLTCFLLVSSLSVSLLVLAENQEPEFTVPLVKGLSWSFYEKSCPEAEDIVRKQLKKVFKEDIGQAAGLLRLHFHDCFVQVTIFFAFLFFNL